MTSVNGEPVQPVPSAEPVQPAQPAQPFWRRGRIGKIFAVAAVPVASVFLALIVAAVIILISSIVTTGSIDWRLPIVAYGALLEGSVGSCLGGPEYDPPGHAARPGWARRRDRLQGRTLQHRRLRPVPARGDGRCRGRRGPGDGAGTRRDHCCVSWPGQRLGRSGAGSRGPQGPVRRPRGRHDDHAQLDRRGGDRVPDPRAAPGPRLLVRPDRRPGQQRAADHPGQQHPPRGPARRRRRAHRLVAALSRARSGSRSAASGRTSARLATPGCARSS